MSLQHRVPAALWTLGFCLLLIGSRAGGARAIETFNALLEPSVLSVPVGTDFEVAFAVDSTAHEFNGYEATIRFDPGYVSFLRVAEGNLMTGACPDRFRYLTTPDDSTIDFVHVLLCNGVSLNGPGTLSTYSFHAERVGAFNLRLVGDPDQTFYDAGNYVSPSNPTYPRQVVLHDARVVIYDPTSDVPVGAGAIHSLRVQVVPNPVPDRAEIRFILPEGGRCDLTIVDASGRVVWSRSMGSLSAGVHAVPWPTERRFVGEIPSGVFFCRVHEGNRSGVVRLSVLHM